MVFQVWHIFDQIECKSVALEYSTQREGTTETRESRLSELKIINLKTNYILMN